MIRHACLLKHDSRAALELYRALKPYWVAPLYLAAIAATKSADATAQAIVRR